MNTNTPKTRVSVFPVVFWLLILSGCGQTPQTPDVSIRYFDFFLSSIPKSQLPDNTFLAVKEEIINADTIRYSHVLPQTPLISSTLSVVQPLSIHHDHRLTGITFLIQPIENPCTIHPGIITRETTSAFLYYTPIHLEPDIWNRVTLNFRDFSHVSTRIHTDTDMFNPAQWNRINLFLILQKCDNEMHGLNWGPVTLQRRNRLYDVFRM